MKQLFLILCLTMCQNIFADTVYKCGISNMESTYEGYFIMDGNACDIWFETQKNNHSCIGGGCIQLKVTPTQQEIDAFETASALGD